MIKKKLGTRLLSVLMALTMLLGLVPMTALADEPAASTGAEYSKSYTSTDFSGKFISSMEYSVSTTDSNGAKLEDGSGEISMIEGAGEWVDQVWTRTERCKEWTKIIGLLQDAGVSVDSRLTMVFDLSLKDSSGEAISLDGSKTSCTVKAEWGGVCNYKVYIYDGSKVYEETEGTHENADYSEVFAGYHAGIDEFTVPAGCKAVYVSELTPAEALAPGAYTVDADLTVLGKNNQVLNGTQVYLSNPDLPPTTPMKQKGYLVVHEDGTMTLSLDGFNHIFSQQTITSGKDVTVDELRYFNLREYWMESATSESEKEAFKEIPEKCIDGITVTLKNYNGFYSFGDCTQFPVILFTETDMCLDMTVDFSSAVKAYERPGEGETAYTKTFTDESTGVSVFVETTEDWGQKLADASLSISYLDERDSRYEDAKFQMDRLCVRDWYKLLAFTLTDSDGNELSLEGNCQATVSGADVSGWTNPVVYQLKGDIARTKNISADISDNKASFIVRDLDTVALVGRYSRTDSGITKGALPFVWLRSEAADNSYSLTEYMISTEGAQVDEEYGQTASSTYLDCKVSTTMRKTATEQGDCYYAQLVNPDNGSSFNNTFRGISKVEVQLPYDAAKPYYYIVLTDGTSTYVKQYTDTIVHNGSVYFDIINSFGQSDTVISFDDGTYDQDWGNILLDALARGWNGAVPSSEKPTAYILNSDKLYAGQPYTYLSKAKTYSGKELSDTNRVYNDSVVLSGDYTAKDAGTYTYTATPVEGRTWLDGTSEPFTCEWTIGQKKLTVQYAGETIHEGETPELKATYTGWADGESEENAKGFEPASITAPETLSIGSYSLKPEGGKADNYSFYRYRAGSLYVVSADTKIIDKPTAVPGKLLADGSEKTGVLEGEGYTLTGNTATEGGKSYTAAATLNEGCAWSGGDTSSSCKVTWSIWKGIEKPVFEKTVFEYTGSRINLDAENKYTWADGYTFTNTYAAAVGSYTTEYTPTSYKYCVWADGTDNPVVINWSIVEPAKSADYTAVDAAIAKIPADLSVYTDESVKALTDAKNAVVRDLASDKQSEVDAMAKAIEDAVAGLVKKDSGSSEVKVVSTSIVTANLFVPGELNKQLPGVTAYMTNPNNPLGVVPEGYSSVESKAPTEPVSNNAVLTEYSDGTVTVTVPVPNPVFTLQKIDGGSNAKVISSVRDNKTYSSSDGSVSRNGRITSITVQLKDKSGSYVFSDCTEFPTLLGTDWNVPLTLSVEFQSVTPVEPAKSADYTAVDAALAKIPADLSGYTDESVKALSDAKNAVVRDLAADRQSEVDAMAKAIEDAVAGLVKKTDPEPTPDVKKFSDVPADSYCAKAVDWAVASGVTKGTTETTFSPDTACTRAQAVTLLWRAAGCPEPTLTKNPFTDLSSDSFCYKAVLWAYEKGITLGTTATTFAPNAAITRAQAVTFVYRAAGSPKVSGNNVFTDVDSGSFCFSAVLWAAENGITLGTTAATFSPNAGCTRGQLVTFLYRQLDK